MSKRDDWCESLKCGKQVVISLKTLPNTMKKIFKCNVCGLEYLNIGRTNRKRVLVKITKDNTLHLQDIYSFGKTFEKMQNGRAEFKKFLKKIKGDDNTK